MKICIPAVFIFLVLLSSGLTSCGEVQNSDEAVGAYAEENGDTELLKLREAAKSANPDGQEFILEEEGIFIMLPDKDFKISSEENGCIVFSDGEETISLYYKKAEGFADADFPKSPDDVLKILEEAQIPRESAEVSDFGISEETGRKICGYTIKFSLKDKEGNPEEFYSVSRSICTERLLCIASCQAYGEKTLKKSRLAVDSLDIYDKS